MDINLWMLHCGALSGWPEFRPETFSDTVRSRRHYSTGSRFSWSDIGYYHMVWMAVSLKIILCWNSVIQIRKLEYFRHLPMYVICFMYDCIVLTNITFIFFWHYKRIYIFYPIFLCLYDDVLQILCTLKVFFFLWHLFITYILFIKSLCWHRS